MKRLEPGLFLLSLLLMLLIAMPAYAGSSEWEALNEEVKSLYTKGDYEHALVAAKKALQVAEQPKEPDNNRLATSLHNLADIYRSQHQYTLAEPLYQRSLAI